MFEVALFDDAKSAVRFAKDFLTKNYSQENLLLSYTTDNDSVTEDSLDEENISFLGECMHDLNDREGKLVCCRTKLLEKDQNKVNAFDFFDKPDEFDIEMQKKIDMFNGTGGSRELFIDDKSEYLRKHCPRNLNGSYEHCNSDPESYEKAGYDYVKKDFSNLEARRMCVICQSIFNLGDFKVEAYLDMEFIVCPHFPLCSGNILHWMPTEKPVQVSHTILDSKNNPQQKTEREENQVVRECNLSPREGIALICRKGAEIHEHEFVVMALKRDMYENMKQEIQENLEYNPLRKMLSSMIDIMNPALFISIDYDEEEMEELFNDLDFGKNYKESGEVPGETFLDIEIAKDEKVGRNDPCPCNSGKKYKKCCMKNHEE